VTTETGSAEAPQVFTDEWVAWLDSVLSQCSVGRDVDLVLEHRVADEDGLVFCWHVRVTGGRVWAATGPAGEAYADRCVSFTSDRDTAWAIAAEGSSAQRAFAQGRLHLDGDPRLLIAARPAMDAIGAALSPPAQRPSE
jgi:predicted lipid carrier protein YhbT